MVAVQAKMDSVRFFRSIAMATGVPAGATGPPRFDRDIARVNCYHVVLVVVIVVKTLKVTGEVKTNQPDTDSLIYDPASKHIFTFSSHSHNTTVIDPVKETVLKNLDLVGPSVQMFNADRIT
jgi:hypothetical protein